jgi:Protein of unknown function (DUF3558)
MGGQMVSTRRDVRLALCVVTAAAVTVAGCSDQISGYALKATRHDPPPPARYASMLSEKERTYVSQAAAIRAVDPCGYLDRASVDKLGVIDSFTAKDSQTDCELTVVVGRDRDKSLDISVSIIPKGSTYEHDSHTVTVVGKPIIENTDKYPGRPANPGYNFCYNLIPFGDHSVVKVAVKRSTNDAACNEAHTLVEGVIPRLADWPQRATSSKQAYHAISVRDPCDLLVTLGSGHRVVLSTEILSPWACRFNLDNDDMANYYKVELGWKPNSSFTDPYPGQDNIDIAGHPATRNPLTKSCSIDVAVGEPHDGINYDPIYNSAVTNTVSVMASNCEQAEAAALAAVNEFLG